MVKILYLTYVFLLTTATVTFIELRTKNSLDTFKFGNLYFGAAYFYGNFVQQMSGNKIDYRKINMTRYVDWFIITQLCF